MLTTFRTLGKPRQVERYIRSKRKCVEGEFKLKEFERRYPRKMFTGEEPELKLRLLKIYGDAFYFDCFRVRKNPSNLKRAIRLHRWKLRNIKAERRFNGFRKRPRTLGNLKFMPMF